jgi:hypothetical protein
VAKHAVTEISSGGPQAELVNFRSGSLAACGP